MKKALARYRKLSNLDQFRAQNVLAIGVVGVIAFALLVLAASAEPHTWDSFGYYMLFLGALLVDAALVLLLVIVSLVGNLLRRRRGMDAGKQDD